MSQRKARVTGVHFSAGQRPRVMQGEVRECRCGAAVLLTDDTYGHAPPLCDEWRELMKELGHDPDEPSSVQLVAALPIGERPS